MQNAGSPGPTLGTPADPNMARDARVETWGCLCQILCIPACCLVRVKAVKRSHTQIACELQVLTAQKTGFVPALPFTLHFLSKVDGFLAAATLVSSSKRHSANTEHWLVYIPHSLCICSELSFSRQSTSATLWVWYSDDYKRKSVGLLWYIAFFSIPFACACRQQWISQELFRRIL